MKRVFTILLIGISQFAFSQNFKTLEEAAKDNQRAGTVLGFPNFDSLNFEFRFHEWGFGSGEYFLQITKDKENNWNYRISFISYDSLQRVITFEENTKNIDWEKLWTKLDSLDIKSISDQLQLKLVYTRDDGSQTTFNNHRFFEQIMDGEYYYMEWYDTSGYQEIGYDNPFDYEKILEQHKLSDSNEHKRFNQAILTLNETFDLKRTYKELLFERLKYYESRKKKKKRKTSK